ncbi:hypothetical protein DAEQUDRAFT_721410 [Daedalea quercina L-15889]|uniref:Uncharacterized protein n=1 Tax=Daedalea quercina L-15889 TaxID=1314783 RepID=A0A165TTB8_9APHY|nr:hypothetical protein DAEQUDRAFT_721410 [Daedalea quercina L-15889]
MKFTTLTSALACVVSVLAQGTINQPVAWTAIAPSSVFNFSYSINADYCKSSYGYAVYIVTETPVNTEPAQQYMSGYYLGHYDAENYPAVPYPTNPAPPNFTMPNFADSQGGFGAGKSASNATFNIMVMEEWDDCEGALGRKISMTMNPVVYNATEGYQAEMNAETIARRSA